MVRIDFTGAGQYWLSCPAPSDGGGGGGTLWIDLGECETEADLLAAALTAVNEYTEATCAAGESCWDGRTAAEMDDSNSRLARWVAGLVLLQPRC